MSQFDKTNAIFGFSTLKNPQFRSNFLGNKFSVDQCNASVDKFIIVRRCQNATDCKTYEALIII